MDPLSEILNAIRLEGAVYLDGEFTAPWCIEARYGLEQVRARLADAEHVVFFHFVAEGSCRVRGGDGAESRAEVGDLILFTQDERQVLGSDLRLTPDDAGGGPIGLAVTHLRHGGGGARTRLVCGYLGCNRSVYRTLLTSLPRVLRVPAGAGPAGAMLRELLANAVRESSESQPGSGSALAKLSELLFVQALRRYIAELPEGRAGWLAGMRDVQVGRALALLHAHPERQWSVEQLAREVAMSRSAFAERFTALVNEPPMQYLLRWRLAIAADALRSTDEAIARIAQRSGYESDAAFNRAFKREFGVPPAAWRKARAS